MSHIERINNKYVWMRRGHEIKRAKATLKVEWLRIIKKSRSGVEHVDYIPVLQKV